MIPAGSRPFPLLPLLLLAPLLAAPSCGSPAGSGLPEVELTAGGKRLRVEVAERPADLATGLMFRESLPKDRGMLFVFPSPAPRTFWMKNTYIPLDIAFLDEEGRILNILQMPPLSEEHFRSRGPARYAVEMNAGWFSRHGIRSGDRIEGIPKNQELMMENEK